MNRRGLRRRYGRAGRHGGESFFDAYVTAALWLSNDELDDSGGAPLDQNYSASDLSASTRAEMRGDCARFQKKAKPLLRKAYATGYDKAQAGQDFWLSRNGHGAGFFTRNLGEVGDELQDVADEFGGFRLYVGDDGKIHGSRG